MVKKGDFERRASKLKWPDPRREEVETEELNLEETSCEWMEVSWIIY